MWTVQFCQNVSHRFVSDSLFTDQGPSESTSTIVIILFTWPLLQHTRHPLSKHRIDSEDRNINKNQQENNWKNTRKLSQKMVIKEIRGWFWRERALRVMIGGQFGVRQKPGSMRTSWIYEHDPNKDSHSWGYEPNPAIFYRQARIPRWNWDTKPLT